mmetsp:Transcript_25013/g.36738  ORF Transcript_25013/g.36738 Transcript_25013/m.36738 type:complete len:88 (+) Transcript_25013:224-487(+)
MRSSTSASSCACQSSATDLKLNRQLILCLTSEADSELQEANNCLEVPMNFEIQPSNLEFEFHWRSCLGRNPVLWRLLQTVSDTNFLK